MKNGLKILLVVMITVLMPLGACGQLDNDLSIMPDKNIQDQIERMVFILHKHWKNQVAETEVRDELERLKKMDKDTGNIIIQVLLYKIKYKNDEKKLHAAMIILGNLYSEIPTNELSKAIEPYLATKNKELKNELNEILFFIKKKRQSETE